jgi:hypothetical protein
MFILNIHISILIFTNKDVRNVILVSLTSISFKGICLDCDCVHDIQQSALDVPQPDIKWTQFYCC